MKFIGNLRTSFLVLLATLLLTGCLGTKAFEASMEAPYTSDSPEALVLFKTVSSNWAVDTADYTWLYLSKDKGKWTSQRAFRSVFDRDESSLLDFQKTLKDTGSGYHLVAVKPGTIGLADIHTVGAKQHFSGGGMTLSLKNGVLTSSQKPIQASRNQHFRSFKAGDLTFELKPGQVNYIGDFEFRKSLDHSELMDLHQHEYDIAKAQAYLATQQHITAPFVPVGEPHGKFLAGARKSDLYQPKN